MNDSLFKYIEHGFLAMTMIASVNCLVRTDFNFPVGLLFYYLWHKGLAKEIDISAVGKKILVVGVLVAVLDLGWLIVMGSSWHGISTQNTAAWSAISGIHGFVLFLSWVNWILRVTPI